MSKTIKPALFGINNSNKDFCKAENWGKNIFNNTFPIALANYMFQQEKLPVYLTIDQNLNIKHSNITKFNLFGDDSNETFYAFESDFVPYRKFVSEKLARIDIVTQVNDICLRGLEIKLTALPDNSTCELTEDQYGCELVIRQDTIVYCALSIILSCDNNHEFIKHYLSETASKINNWTKTADLLPHIPEIFKSINNLLTQLVSKQLPLIIQPIWKTEKKKPILSDNCLDIFVWSNLAFTRLFMSPINDTESISRQTRSMIWLFKMLWDFSLNTKFNPKDITDNLTFKSNNDKAFALSGKITNQYMRCPELFCPRITKWELKNIILGNGQKFLSPERRFDAVLFYNQGELFNE